MNEIELQSRLDFAGQLELAHQQFRIMLALIEGELVIQTAEAPTHPTSECSLPFAKPRIIQALAKEFIFHVNRIHRMCDHGKTILNIEESNRRAFLAAVKPIVGVRHVNEHGFDLNRGARGRTTRPVMHYHEADNAQIDETSLIILGPDKILIGPLNLVKIFHHIEVLRNKAGYSSFTQEQLLPAHLRAPT
jgi:hypothetical protein